MHEFTIVENMVRTAERFAQDNGIVRVASLTVQIGALTGVIAEYVNMYYADLIKGTVLDGSELTIEKIPAEAFCKSCGEVFDPTKTESHCPACGREKLEILHGEELTVKDMGFM